MSVCVRLCWSAGGRGVEARVDILVVAVITVAVQGLCVLLYGAVVHSEVMSVRCRTNKQMRVRFTVKT